MDLNGQPDHPVADVRRFGQPLFFSVIFVSLWWKSRPGSSLRQGLD
jgi:hypothetical protein